VDCKDKDRTQMTRMERIYTDNCTKKYIDNNLWKSAWSVAQ